jgi:hypothetical protein
MTSFSVFWTDLVEWEPQTRLLPVRGKGLSHLNQSLSTEHSPLFCPS